MMYRNNRHVEKAPPKKRVRKADSKKNELMKMYDPQCQLIKRSRQRSKSPIRMATSVRFVTESELADKAGRTI
jgi:hypothetical protein